MIERASDPGKGNWSFPGGRIKLGETVLEAAKREVLEETGIEIEPLEIFQVYDWITRDDTGRILFHYVVHYVRARYLSGDPRAQDDAARALWVTETGIAHLPMHPFARETAVRLLQEAEPSPQA
jgi:ADP-ribose pyrophosphatase YjhB (NUDIX family)